MRATRFGFRWATDEARWTRMDARCLLTPNLNAVSALCPSGRHNRSISRERALAFSIGIAAASSTPHLRPRPRRSADRRDPQAGRGRSAGVLGSVAGGDKWGPAGVDRSTSPKTWAKGSGMARPNPRKLPSAPMAGAPAAQFEEALRLGRTKEAVELYKQLLKQEARPEWRDALADAYLGRAKALCSPRGCSRRPRSFSATRRRWTAPSRSRCS